MAEQEIIVDEIDFSDIIELEIPYETPTQIMAADATDPFNVETTSGWEIKTVDVITLAGEFKVSKWYKTEEETFNSESDNEENLHPGPQSSFQMCTPKRARKRYSTENPVLICPLSPCRKVFLRSGFRRHLQTHEPKRQTCEICLRAFRDRSNLKRHQLVHTISFKPFQCDFEGCEKRFSLHSNLEIHQRIHTEERSFRCPVRFCHKSFTQAGNLKSHFMIHQKAAFH